MVGSNEKGDVFQHMAPGECDRVDNGQPLDVSRGIPRFGVLELAAPKGDRTPLTPVLLF